MIIDKRNEFCDNTALNTGAAGSTYTVGNQIDLAESPFPGLTTLAQTGGASTFQQTDIGAGEPLFWVVSVGANGITAANSGSIQFQLCSADNDALTTNVITHLSTGSIATGTSAIAAGTVLAILRVHVGDTRRYLGVRHFTGTQAITAGTIDSFLTSDVTRWKAYADGVTQNV